MRRVMLIGSPAIVLIATFAVFAIWRAQLNDPIRPLNRYVTYQQTVYVPPGGSTQEGAVQVWTWLRPDSAQSFPEFAKWLRSKQDWTVIQQGSFLMASRGPALVPDDYISVDRSRPDTILMIYSHKPSLVEFWVDRIFFKKLDNNNPPTQP